MNGTNNTAPQLMSIPDAAQYFGLSEYSIRKGIKANSIPHLKLGGKYYICVRRFQQLIQADYSQ